MWTLIVHGGAKEIKPNKEDANRKGCLRALEAGRKILAENGSAVDAVEAAVRVLEDDPTFNAGYGSVLNADGEVEMSASIMDGSNLNVGAVAAIQGVWHPVSVAKELLNKDPILMVGEGARQYASELCDPRELISLEQEKSESHDTVGCVALDQQGNLAASASTGGLEGVPPGRVGDSPQPGCGFYAENAVGAVAFSGDGEHIARLMLAARVMSSIEMDGPQKAVEQALRELERIEGTAGGIVIAPNGKIGWAHNTPDFAVATISSSEEEPRVYLRQAEALTNR